MLQIARSHKVIGYNNRGQYYDDIPSIETSPTSSKITRIKVHVREAIVGLRVFWNTHNGARRGSFSSPGETRTLSLLDDEFITRVEGTTTGSWDSDRVFNSLCFYTNHGTVERFGKIEGEKFAFDADDGLDESQESPMGLLSFETWIHQSKILALRPTFAEYPIYSDTYSDDEMGMKYECIGDAQSGSSFQQHLSSQTIALHIGTAPNMITLHAREDMLCRLPFFVAALHGGFKEAAEKAISMPEDYPDVISALLEYLSTDTYTYAYQSETINKEAELFFHLDLYAAAKKYGAENLMHEATENFVEVLKAVRDCSGASRLRLWRHAYDAGLRATNNWNTGNQVHAFRKRIVGQVGKVLAECKAEFDAAVREVEWFGLDIISIVTEYSEDE